VSHGTKKLGAPFSKLEEKIRKRRLEGERWGERERVSSVFLPKCI
jgi:hypothetical protein